MKTDAEFSADRKYPDYTPDPLDCQHCGGSGIVSCLCSDCGGTGNAPKTTVQHSEKDSQTPVWGPRKAGEAVTVWESDLHRPLAVQDSLTQTQVGEGQMNTLLAYLKTVLWAILRRPVIANTDLPNFSLPPQTNLLIANNRFRGTNFGGSVGDLWYPPGERDSRGQPIQPPVDDPSWVPARPTQSGKQP